MEEKKRNKIKKYRIIILSFVSIFILFWIFLIKIFSGYFYSSVDSNWEQIKTEKISYQNEICRNIYQKYLGELSGLSKNIANNLDIRNSVTNGEQRKIFDILLKQNLPSSVQLEMYNKRAEITAYIGRNIEPNFLMLQKALKGKESYLLKEIGFYTYLVSFTPIRDITNESNVTGVLVTAFQIDLKTQIQNNYFEPFGLTKEIFNELKITTEIIPNNSVNFYHNSDTVNISASRFIDLNANDGTVLGKLKIPEFEKGIHLNSLEEYSSKIISVLVFLFTCVFGFLLYILFKDIKRSYLKVLLMFFYLAMSRFLWVIADFPDKILSLDIFSPSYYAVTYSFGMLKSLGDLVITASFCLFFCIYISFLIQRKIQNKNENIYKPGYTELIPKITAYIAVSFFITYIYGYGIHSIVFDSNIKFLELTEFVPGLELFIIQCAVLIITFSYIIVLLSFFLKIYYLSGYIIPFNILRKMRIIFIILLFIIISSLLGKTSINFVLLHYQRVLIFFVLLIFCVYIFRMMQKTVTVKYLNVKNISYLFIICILIIPFLLFENLKKKEVKYVELIGRELIQPSEEKAAFVIADELMNNAQNKEIFENLRKNNKLTELAFYIWANGKLINENYNSAVIILDTNENIISDFNLSPTEILSDTVVNFVKRKYFNLEYDFSAPDSEMDSTLGETIIFEDEGMPDEEENVYLPSIYENVEILRFSDEKLLIGIVSIENIDLKNTQFEKIYGYLLVVVNYSRNNLFNPTSFSVFRAKSKNSLFEKLFSDPAVTEFENGDILNTTDNEIAKVNLRTLETSNEVHQAGNEKGVWLFESYNNENYKTFYITTSKLVEQADVYENEKIFAISIKRNDFSIALLYYFKFIIFSVFLYTLLYIFFSLRLIFKLKHIEFLFREKLFASFLIVSVIPIIFLAAYTRTYIKDKNEVNLQNQILSDLNLVNESIKGKNIQFLKYRNPDSVKKSQKNILDKSLAKPDKNFNLFLKDRVVSTTNEELYKSDLLGTRLDAEAYFNIYLLNKDLFLKENYIGKNTFLTGYTMIKGKDDYLQGILSSQSLFKQSEINKELTETLTYIFGSYISAIILLVILVNIFADRLSKPILELKAATEKLSKGHTNFEIRIQRKDEIGDLVDSFNKMTKQITRSKIELKKAEREAAWRDIARRVAHEIKNPLTPMKLAIQYLFEINKNRKNENFDDVLTKTKDMITNEIDKLNKIATDFSNFAKLPGTNYENIKINDVINEVVSLYKTDPKVEFVLKLAEIKSYLYADRQELNRVFQNLITNAIQSIEKTGIIEITSAQTEENINVEIKDSGCGMSPEVMINLFTPNFSTKSTGMGLGLAIVKKSLDDIEASINYDSNIDFGTTVKLKFKLSNKS